MARKKTDPDVLDEVPAGVQDLGAADMAQQASTAVSIFATAPAWQPHPTLQEIEKLKDEGLLLLGSSDLSTEAGYKAVKAYSVAIMRKRTAVDARRLEVTRQARDYVTQANSVGNTVINKLKEIEAPLDAALKAQDDKVLEAALARAKAIEEEQARKENERLALIKADEDRKKAEVEAALAKQKADIELERAKLQAQQEEFNSQQAELRRQQDELRAENERLQREARQRLDAENKRLEDAKQEERRKEEAAEQAKRRQEEEARRIAQAEQDRIATEARVKKAAEDAAALAVKNEQARVARDAETKRIKEEKDRKAAEKKAAQAPDKAKVKAWQLALSDVITTAPKCTDPEAIQLVGRINKDLIAAMTPLKLYAEAK